MVVLLMAREHHTWFTGDRISILLGGKRMSPAGCHQVAARLCRKGLALKGRSSGNVVYRLTEDGYRAGLGEMSGIRKPAP